MLLVVPMLLLGCGGDDDDGGMNGPPPATLAAAAALSADIVDQFLVQNGPVVELSAGMSSQIMRAMAPDAFSTSVAPRSNRVATGDRPVARVTAAKLNQTRLFRSSVHETVPAVATSAVPAVPFEITCEWNPDADPAFWRLDAADQFGEPPADGVRYHLYVTDPGSRIPVVPLSPIDAYADARLLEPQETSAVDAIIQSVQGGRSLIDFRVTGQSTSQIIDLLINGGTLGGTAEDILTFGFDIGNTASTTTVQALTGLLDVVLSLGQVGGQQTVVFEDDESNNRLEFILSFNDDFQITASEVKMNSQTVASASGGIGDPAFTLSSGSPLGTSELANIRQIYRNSLIIDGAIFELFAAGACLGTQDRVLCEFI